MVGTLSALEANNISQEDLVSRSEPGEVFALRVHITHMYRYHESGAGIIHQYSTTILLHCCCSPSFTACFAGMVRAAKET